MDSKVSRRTVLKSGAAVAASVSAIPAFAFPRGQKPLVVASGNGHNLRNSDGRTCVEEAFHRLTNGDPLDAAIAGVNIVELDPADTSVGFGGLPNADGVVQLDSCCMHGPKNWAGGVAALEGVRTPSSVAQLVAQQTDHHLLVGKGAQQFARNMGFKIEDDLNSETSRRLWLEWKRRTDPDHYLDPAKRGGEALLSMIADGLVDPHHAWGTINCCVRNQKSEIAGVTTTSGLAFKIPGRVGDSPILGAGLYVDNEFGAAGSTGRGEANLYNCSSFLIVEELRRGAHPKDAALAAMKRIRAQTVEKRLRRPDGSPNFGLEFYVLDKRGRHAGVSTNPGARFAVCDENGARFEPCEIVWRN